MARNTFPPRIRREHLSTVVYRIQQTLDGTPHERI